MLQEATVKSLLNLCSKLIKTPSFSGKEGKIVNELKEIFKFFGYDGFFIDKYGSIVAYIKGNRQGPKILLDAHIDTVPVSDSSKWIQSPYGGELVEGKIYGRGASDMKGALSAMIVAGNMFLKEKGRNFAGEIYVAGVVHEECFEGVAAREISKRVNPDYVIIGEASELNLNCGQRGRAEIVIETFGKPAHSANPQYGINAVYKMTKLIDKIREIETPEHEVLGKGIIELTDIISSPYPGKSVVPDRCKATYDRRLLVDEKPEEVLKPLKDIIEKFNNADEEFNARISYAVEKESCYTGNYIESKRYFLAWYFCDDEEYIQKILKGLQSIGLKPQISNYSFCTNGSHYAGEKRIRTVGFGPSKENLAHVVDEYIEVQELIKACEGYIKIIEVLLD